MKKPPARFGGDSFILRLLAVQFKLHGTPKAQAGVSNRSIPIFHPQKDGTEVPM